MKETVAKFIVFICCYLAFTVQIFANSINWNNGVYVYPDAVVNSSGVDVSGALNWVLHMYRSTDGNIDFAAGMPGLDESLVVEQTWGDTGLDGYFGNAIVSSELAPYNLVNGVNIYTVLFNATTVAGASEYVVLDAAIFTILYPGSGILDYDPSGSIAGDWQAVPEPSTMALMGLGAAVLFVKRRKLLSNKS